MSIKENAGFPTKEQIRESLELRQGKELQDKLENARVAICGLGGLGSAIAISLARAGVGHLHLIDFDLVDLSNTNRQQYALSQIGMPKPEALKEEIQRFAPYIEIGTTFERITEENFRQILSDVDYICEAFDRADQKAMLTNLVLEHFPKKYLIGASGVAGYGDSNSITTRRITSHFYLCGDGKTEVGEGVSLVAPRVYIAASHQANLVIELIGKR